MIEITRNGSEIFDLRFTIGNKFDFINEQYPVLTTISKDIDTGLAVITLKITDIPNAEVEKYQSQIIDSFQGILDLNIPEISAQGGVGN